MLSLASVLSPATTHHYHDRTDITVGDDFHELPECKVTAGPKIPTQFFYGPFKFRDADGQSLLWMSEGYWIEIDNAAPAHLIQLSDYSVVIYDDDGCVYLAVPANHPKILDYPKL